MEEKTYKLLGGSGALNIAVGAVVLVSGIASGVLLIVNGARQLAHRGKLIFCVISILQSLLSQLLFATLLSLRLRRISLQRLTDLLTR